MQLAEFPPETVLAEAYAEAESPDYVEEEAGQRETARRVLARIERHARPGRLLDLGCWVGFLVDEARGRGWTAVGVEPSEFASRFARERLGLDVRTESLMAADLPEASFDATFMGDVIEHIPDAPAALGRVRALLAPGGVHAMALPDAGSRVARLMGRRWWSVIPTHVHYFTRRSVATMLEREGFDLLEVTTAPKAFTAGYYLDRIGGYAPRLSAALARGARAARLADRIWAPDFRDRMLVIARPRR
jgi:SAM-dependent methyltransferase